MSDTKLRVQTLYVVGLSQYPSPEEVEDAIILLKSLNQHTHHHMRLRLNQDGHRAFMRGLHEVGPGLEPSGPDSTWRGVRFDVGAWPVCQVVLAESETCGGWTL